MQIILHFDLEENNGWESQFEDLSGSSSSSLCRFMSTETFKSTDSIETSESLTISHWSIHGGSYDKVTLIQYRFGVYQTMEVFNQYMGKGK